MRVLRDDYSLFFFYTNALFFDQPYSCTAIESCLINCMVENLRASRLIATNSMVDLSKLRCQEKPGHNVDIDMLHVSCETGDRMLFAADAAKLIKIFDIRPVFTIRHAR